MLGVPLKLVQNHFYLTTERKRYKSAGLIFVDIIHKIVVDRCRC